VSPVRGRIDQPAAAAGPEHVAGPAVAVYAAGRLRRTCEVSAPSGSPFPVWMWS
jgi:hypothetical protein